MNKKYFLILSPIVSLVIYLTMSSYSSGVTGNSLTGCGSGCHGGTSTGNINTSVTLNGLPSSGYLNGAVYSVTVTVTNNVILPSSPFGLRDGFDLTASAGSFTAIAGTSTTVSPVEIRHTAAKTVVGGVASWTFNWTAPATGTASIIFYLAGNATNGNNSNSGDQWNKISTTLAHALSVTATSSPAITCNGGLTTITASATNGVSPYQYKLNSGAYQPSSSFPSTSAGTYTITAIDAASVTATTIITIAQPALLTFNSPTINAPLCFGGTGTASITATGGTGTQTYSITPLGPQTNTTGNFTGLTAQVYTVTVTDANLCTKTSTILVGQPSQLSLNSANITMPICFGGNGSASITANGGTGTKTYTITPLGPQSNTTGNFTGLTSQNYTITVTDANLCSQTSSIFVSQPAPIAVTSSNVTGCQGSPISLIGSPIGGTFSVSNPYTGPSTNYTYTYTDGFGCSNTSAPSFITSIPVNSTNIVMPVSGSSCQTLIQSVGNNIYSNPSCELITNISATGLGNTVSCVSFLPGTPSYNGEPYANRVYSITPAIQPASIATVCLYYTIADLAAAGISPLVNTDISITKVGGNGILGGSGSVEEIINSLMSINNLSGGNKEVCFPVTSFSSFYLHSKNPLNIPLPVSILDFSAKLLEKADLIEWKTSYEMKSDYFNVQHSQDGIKFETIGNIISKAIDGFSAHELSYSFSNANLKLGYNFYRLEQVDIDGRASYSPIISLYRNFVEEYVQVYPNPTSGEFSIQTSSPISIFITDVKGELVYESHNSFNETIRLARSGLYFIKLKDIHGNSTIKKLVVTD